MRDSATFSHLMFADDIILFGEANLSTLDSMNSTLMTFFTLSGHSMNCNKSSLFFSPNTPTSIIDDFEQTLEVTSTRDLGIYLGFPLTVRKPTRRNLFFILEKVSSKLASWKTKTLSKAGRLILINSTLLSIPRYYMQAISFPKSILNKLDSITSGFFWGSSEQSRKISWISWKNICTPKELGGLGLVSNHDLNKVSLARTCWRLDNHINWAAGFLKEKYLGHRPVNFNKGSHI